MLRRCVDGRRFCGSRLQRLSPLHLSLHTSSPHRPVSEPGWEKKHCLRGRGSGPHIQGACLIPLMSSSLLLLGGLLKAHPQWFWIFPSPGGCKKSFVIWQKFCDYGRDHCETFSELVHINDFKGLWVSKMRPLKKARIRLIQKEFGSSQKVYSTCI